MDVELDCKESWAPKNWCFWNVVLEKTLESPLDFKEIQPVPPKGNQSLIFIGRTDAEAEIPILCPPDAKNWLNGKDPDAGKDWRQEEKGTSRGWDGWMASPTWWTWVWGSRSWWWTAKPGMLRSMESQRVGHTWATELNWLHARHYARSSTFIPVWNPQISLIQEALRSFGVTEPTGNRVPTCKLRRARLQNLFFEGQQATPPLSINHRNTKRVKFRPRNQRGIN